MRRAALLLVTILPTAVVFAVLTARNATPSAAATTPGPLVERGREVFLTACTSCHGSRGQGTDQGPTLVGVGAAAADFQLSTGRMPLANPNAVPVRKQPAFGADQIRALVAYVASLGPGTPIPDVDPAAGELSRGGELFRSNCAACHSASGVGGALSLGADAPSLRSATATQVGEAMRTGPGQMPVFGPDTLSKHQVDELDKFTCMVRDRLKEAPPSLSNAPTPFLDWASHSNL
ncbi:MAG: c-type cytochrome, partial [Acidimicrobiia bacterium]